MWKLIAAALAGMALAAGLAWAAGGTAVGATGRWHIVNPTPSFARNTMLLDSVTGDTWIMCEDSEGMSKWCRVPKTDHITGNEKPPAKLSE